MIPIRLRMKYLLKKAGVVSERGEKELEDALRSVYVSKQREADALRGEAKGAWSAFCKVPYENAYPVDSLQTRVYKVEGEVRQLESMLDKF